MRYVVDRVVDNIVVLENMSNRDIIEVSVTDVPENIKDGNILIKQDNKFILDKETEKERRKNIRDKFNKLLGDSND